MAELDGLQQANLAEIESLNQRGGRTLSVVDLIADGTLTVEIAGYLLAKMASGASVLTAAQASGTGKSTLLANLLGFLPPHEPVISTSDAGVIASGLSAGTPACYLAHEIGSGPWYGYIWGRQVGEFLRLRERGHRLAAAIHADTMDELIASLAGSPLNVSGEALEAIGLIAFMAMQRTSAGIARRVTTIHELTDNQYRLAWAWDAERDSFVQPEPGALTSDAEAKTLASAPGLIRRLVSDDIRDFRTMRSTVLDWYASRT